MTARPQDVALLQLPALEPELEDLHPGLKGFIYMYARDYARANVTAALASAQAREEELRAEVERLTGVVRGMANEIADTRHRAERLEEALRDERAAERAVEASRSVGWRPAHEGEEETYYERLLAAQDAYQNARARTDALSTNAATQTGETT